MTTPPPIAPVAPINVPTNHLLHFLMGLMTCGGWWLAWPFIHIGNVRANAARWRQYERSVALYQRALWERENMPGQPARPRWEPVWQEGRAAVPDHFITPAGMTLYERPGYRARADDKPGYGDVMHGYRPAVEDPVMARRTTHEDYQEMARQRRAPAQPRPAGVPPRVDQPSPPPPASPPSQDGPVLPPPPASAGR